MGQDNREPGENPGRSRRCVSGAFFEPKGSHCENGKTKNVMMRSQKTCLFIGTGIVYNEECQDYKNCGRQVLVKKNSFWGFVFVQ